jgi:proteasome lid subunit RPN8/RPN11
MLQVRRPALEAVIAHARESAPDECCGLLIGSRERVESAHRAVNLRASPTRFLIDPRDHFAALRAVRRRGQAVVGVYHSHPASAAKPSPTDLAEASYPDYLYLIVGLVDPLDIRLFTLEPGNFREAAFVTVP